MKFGSVRRSPERGPSEVGGVSQQRLERQLGRAEQRRILAERGRYDPDKVASRRQRATIELGLDQGAT